MTTFGGALALNAIPVANLPVTVPANFVGMHFRGWPITNPSWHQECAWPSVVSPDPVAQGLAFDTYRTHDNGFSFWYQIETSAGVYSTTALANLDTIITKHRQAGRTVIFQVYGTPQFYIANADPNKAVVDTYSIAGGNCYPGATVGIEGVNGLTGLANFCTMIINRYNKAGGSWYNANFGTLGKGIQIVEAWNEADINNISGFWQGTRGQITDLAYTVYTAVKAADSAVTVLSPSFGLFENGADFLGRAGTINTGVIGNACCDGLALHSYGHTLPYQSFSDCGVDILNGRNCGIRYYRNLVNGQAWQNKDIYLTECGISVAVDFSGWANGGNPLAGGSLALSIAQTPAWRYQYWARMMMLWASYGFKMVIPYCWERPFIATPMNDAAGTGVLAAISLIRNRVSGKTINSAYLNVGGEVTLNFSDSTSLTV